MASAVLEVATEIIEAAAAIFSTIASFDMLDVARDYYDIYDAQRRFYHDTFQLGVETPLAAELFGQPIYVLNYNTQIDTLYDPNTGPFGGDSTDVAGWWNRHAAMYSTKPDDSITELNPDLARLQSDWANYLFRYEEHYGDVLNDIRFNNRLMMHNTGLKQMTSVSASLSTSFAKYEEALNDTLDTFAALGNGAAQLAGYRKGLTDTADAINSNPMRVNSQNVKLHYIDNIVLPFNPQLPTQLPTRINDMSRAYAA